MDERRTPAQRRAEAAARAQQRAQRRGESSVVPVQPEAFGDDPAAAWTDEPLDWEGADAPAPPARRRAVPAGAPARRRAASAAAITVQQRRLAAIFGAVALVAVVFWVSGLGGDDEDLRPSTAAAEAEPDRPAELPGGGRRLFPDRRIVAFAGNPDDERLGALGVGSDKAMIRRLRKAAKPYARASRPVLPALELITSVAQADPGSDGSYVSRLDDASIDRYLKLARREKMLLLLDVQPGLVDFPRELERLRPWLVEPDVGLALDPEWRVEPGQVPGQVIGSVSAAEVNATSLKLAQIVRENNLPEKLFVIHQFTEGMIRQPEQVIERPGLATVFNVDGVGTRAAKVAKYRELTATKLRFRHGFKLFLSEDTGLMKPGGVMAMTPRPDLIVLE